MASTLSFNCLHRYPSGFRLDAKFETCSQVTGLSGPSGSGKTTILALIAGLLRPESGSIRVGDELLTDTASKVHLQPEKRKIGMLFQDQNLFPHLRVRANIQYGMRRRRQRVLDLDRIIKTLELEDLLGRYPRTLSGGQQQRVALARAIASNPRLLLLDEPLTSVESELRVRITDFVERVINEFEIPTIVVSHNNDLVSRLASKVIVIDRGQIARKTVAGN